MLTTEVALAWAQDAVDLMRETMCQTVLSNLGAGRDATARSRGSLQVPQSALCMAHELKWLVCTRRA